MKIGRITIAITSVFLDFTLLPRSFIYRPDNETELERKALYRKRLLL